MRAAAKQLAEKRQETIRHRLQGFDKPPPQTCRRHWSPEGMWFAEAGSVVGSVTLAMRGGAHRQSPVTHWLMVAPDWRRRGVGRLLVRALEAACWQAGHRRIGLETHAAWTQANALYRARGYDGGDAHVQASA